jgi:O-antigen ligase/polysaccharide polymerase Wzy-like membrane protein
MSLSRPMSVQGLIAIQRTRVASIVLIGSGAALLVGVLTAELALNGHVLVVAMLAGLAFPVIVWRRPDVGIGLFVLIAAVIEQFPIEQLPMSGMPALIITDQIPLFVSFSGSFGLSGIMVSPLEIALFTTLLVWIMKAILQRKLRLPRSYLSIGIGLFVAILVFGEIQGLGHGGSFRESVDELRPWFYLVVLYLVASQLLDGPAALKPILWAFVIGTGIKGLEGTLRFVLVRGAFPRPDAILAHEEALFFAMFVLLVAALWLFREPSRLRTVGTALLPGVLIADLANNRRAAWLILLAGFLALGVVAWVRLPDRRRVVASWAATLAVVGSIYLAIFWNSNGSLAQPARAIRSAVSPSSRDSLSDLYRTQENANLALNIKLAGPLGAGFGIPITYALPITDLTRTTPSLAYVPHDGILYVWMRLGIVGILLFWCLIGAAIIAACRLLRNRDPSLALFGGFAVCALIAYVLEGYYDLGLSWFRVAVFVGCILGALEAASRFTPAIEAAGGRTVGEGGTAWPPR